MPSQSTRGAAAGSTTQPIQWSNEFYDSEPALVYYNYRHYNPMDGRWIGRDKIVLTTQYNLYTITSNNTIYYIDRLGLYVVLCFAYKEGIIMGYRRKKGSSKLKKIIEKGSDKLLHNPRKPDDTYLGILLVEKCRKDCEKRLKVYKRRLLSLLMIFFFLMSSMVQATTVVDTNSQTIQIALAIEKIAKSSSGVLKEKKYTKKIEGIIDKVKDEQTLFALAILFREGYPEFYESPEDRLMFYAQEYTVSHLAKMGTERAYLYFKTLKMLYGQDGAGYRKYRLLEYRYLKQYSEDPEVKNAQTDGRWR